MILQKILYNHCVDSHGIRLSPHYVRALKSGQETFDSNHAVILSLMKRYKGFGLSLMIEVLCSHLSGMPYGRSIVLMFTAPLEGNESVTIY